MKIMYNIYFLNILSYAHFDYNDKKTSTFFSKTCAVDACRYYFLFTFVITYYMRVRGGREPIEIWLSHADLFERGGQ